MTLSAIEDYEDIARRLKEIRPEPVKIDPVAGQDIFDAKNDIDWSFFNGGMDGA